MSTRTALRPWIVAWLVVFIISIIATAIRLRSRRSIELETPATVRLQLTIAEERDSIVRAEALRAGAPVGLMLAIARVENPSGDSAAISSAGAVGLMQVMPSWTHSFEAECGCGPLVGRRRNACLGIHIYLTYRDSVLTTDAALRRYHGSWKEHLHRAGDKYVRDVLDQLISLEAS